MGLANNHILGRDGQMYVTVDSTFGTPVAPTDAAGVPARVLEFNVTPVRDRLDREDASGTRSYVERIQGKKKVDWTLKSYLLTGASAGTAPNLRDVWQASMGTETVSGGTSVTYSFNDTQTGLQTLSLLNCYSTIFQQGARGVFVDGGKITASGGEPPMVEFRGGAMHEIRTSSTTLSSSPSSSDTMTLTDVDAVRVGSIISVNGTGTYQVTAISGSTITLDTSITATSGQAVAPALVARTSLISDAPIAGIAGSLTFDGGSAVPITAFEVDWDNGIKRLDDHFGSAVCDDIIPGRRTVTGKATFRARSDLLTYLMNAQNFAAVNIAVALGTTAGYICTVNVPQAEFDLGSINVPVAEEAMIELPFKALSSSLTAADELDIVFT